MGLLEEFRDITITALVGAGVKTGLDYAIANTKLYEVESRLKQGARFVLGLAIAIIVDLAFGRRWPALERLAVSKAIYVASMISLLEQAVPIAAKPLYLNTQNNTLEGYKGTVRAAYMVYDGNVQQIDVTAPAVDKTDGVTTYVVITTEGVYVTTAPYRLQYQQATTQIGKVEPVKKQ